MQTTELLHVAIRANDPQRLAQFYADLFDGQFVIHPVMTGLGIMIVKLNHPEALFHGLLEFWPWDVEWDGKAAVFRKVMRRPAGQSFGHLAVKTAMAREQVEAELKRRGIAYRIEPRSPDLSVPVIDDPEGNLIELFPNIDHMALPPEAMVPRDKASSVIATVQAKFRAATASWPPEAAYPLLAEI